MKNFIVLLSLLVICASYANAASSCYYCANCVAPFNQRAPGVTTVFANGNFCAKKSLSSDPRAPYSLGIAEPGLCVVTGCRWAYDSTGRQIYTCCCNSDYCNGSM